MKDRGNHIIKRLTAALLAFAFVIVLATPAAAADVEWAPGFPKLSEGKMLLMWNVVKEADSYKVYRRRGASGDFVLLTTSKVNRYIDEKTESGHDYTYNVVAMKGEETLGKSEDKKVTIAAKRKYIEMMVPELVGVIEKRQEDNSPSVGIRWEMKARPTDLAVYNVYRATKKGGPYTLIGSAQIRDFEDTDVERGKTYYYTISAVDTNFTETKKSNEMSLEIEVPEVVTPKGKKATKMMAAKHLFDINSYPDPKKRDKDGKPVMNPLVFPVDIAVDEAVGHIYIVSNEYGGVLVYNMEGKFQFAIRKEGVGSKKMIDGLHGCDTGPGGKLYVTGYTGGDIYIYDLTGKLDNIMHVNIEDIPGEKIKKRSTPNFYDVAVNSEGDIYAVDVSNNSVHVFDNRGDFKFDIVGYPEGKDPLFNGPGYAYLDKESRLFLVGTGLGNMLVFDANGKYIREVAKGASRQGEAERLFHPTGVTVDDKGRIFVANGLDPNIQVFDVDGNFLFAVSNETLNGPIKSNNIRGIHVDSKGRLYVTEVLNDTVAVYQLSGEVEEIVVGNKKK